MVNLMIGLEVEEILLRAYSVVSPNYEEYMEWFSLQIHELTSRLQIKPVMK